VYATTHEEEYQALIIGLFLRGQAMLWVKAKGEVYEQSIQEHAAHKSRSTTRARQVGSRVDRMKGTT